MIIFSTKTKAKTDSLLQISNYMIKLLRELKRIFFAKLDVLDENKNKL